MPQTDDDRFFDQIHGDAKRTLICDPHRVDAIQEAVNARGLADILTVQGSRSCPVGKLLILDTPALDAVMRQTFQRAGHGIRLHGQGN